MAQITIKGITYSAEKLAPFDAMEVLRKLAPQLWRALTGMVDEEAPVDETDEQRMAREQQAGSDMIGSIIEAFAKLSRAESQEVMMILLSSIKRKEPQGLGWHPIVAGDGKTMMYQLALPDLLKLVTFAVREQFGDFFADLQGQDPGGPQ